MREITLCDINPSLCQEWSMAFAKLPGVNIVCDKFEHFQKTGCIVTAGNSFGIMDGGIDLAVREFYGVDIQKRVQAQIAHDFCGEMPVGSCAVVKTKKYDHPLVAYAPTMQRPMGVAGTMNAYYAMLATLIATRKVKGIVLIPGFCAGAGKMPTSIVARQMAAAYENHVHNSKYPKLCWDDFKRDYEMEAIRK